VRGELREAVEHELPGADAPDAADMGAGLVLPVASTAA
jgi:hypothetical protein